MANGTFITKQKRALAKDVAKIMPHEVYGSDNCGVTWADLAKRSLLLEALKCPPYGLFTQDELNCMRSKLEEKCNC